jgi:hypothetical protein
MYEWINVQHRWNSNGGRRHNYSHRDLPKATTSTTNATWTVLVSNLALRGQRVATNRTIARPSKNKKPCHLSVGNNRHQNTELYPRPKCIFIFFLSFFPMPPHVPYRLRGLPSRLWPKCNRLLRLGRPWGAVTLSLWGGWWYTCMNMKYVPGGTLNLSSAKLPRPWSPWESSPLRKIPNVRAMNRTRDLMISSQKLWPLDQQFGRIFIVMLIEWSMAPLN